MPKDRREDRHALPGRLIRPDPKELWTKLGEKANGRSRNVIINELITMYLDGKIELDSEKAPPTEQ